MSSVPSGGPNRLPIIKFNPRSDNAYGWKDVYCQFTITASDLARSGSQLSRLGRIAHAINRKLRIHR